MREMGRALTAALLLAGFAAAAGAQAPHIDSLTPSRGPIAGGTAVTVAGSGFAGANLFFDDRSLIPTSATDTEIRFTTPPHDNGYAPVKVSNASGSAYAEYLYVPPRLRDLPPGYITTVAGVGAYRRFHLPARLSPIIPWSLAFDKAGGLLVASAPPGQILRVAPDGTLEPFAGKFPQDDVPLGDGGPATEALIHFPRGVGVDGSGNVYVTDTTNRIRRIDGKTGIITTIAGTGQAGFSGDGGPATAARINVPSFLAARSDGTVYFIDHDNYRIRKISTSGIITTVAGTGVPGESGDGGPATSARFNVGTSDFGALAVAPNGDLFLLESAGGRLRKIDAATGIISTILDRDPHGNPIFDPKALTVDAAGNVYCSTGGNIVKVDASGRLLDFWGASSGLSEDGTPATEARLANPVGLAIDDTGNILYSEEQIRRVRKINRATGLIETVAGIGPRVIGVPGPADGALFGGFFGDVAALPNGTLLVGLDQDRRIFRIDDGGRIDYFAGSGTSFGGIDEVPALQASVTPFGMGVDSAGGVFFADTDAIGRIGPDGIVRRIAGQLANCSFGGDGGPAANASLCQPWDVALDPQDNVFIADTNNNRIRRIDAQTGTITTVGGTGPSNGLENYGHGSYCGDGGPAVNACLNTPYSLAVEPDGTIYVSDTENRRLRRIDPGGTISTFLSHAHAGKMLADGYGGLFLDLSINLAHILPDGTFWSVAGNGERGFSGDGGPARQARISSANAARDDEGNLFFWDPGNQRVRAVRFGAVLAPPGADAQATVGGVQSAPLMKTFGAPLEVTVRTASGSPAPGVRVDFAAPAGGVSCAFSNGSNAISVLTDRSGKARVSCTASCRVGSYTVSATSLGSATTVPFSLTNTPSPAGHLRCTTVVPPRSPIP
ncbi:MAG: IPT/TIG domain-containing protein [Thermoanaerobaculia bacterium]